MQPGYYNPIILHRQRWQQAWPTPLVAIIAIIQMLLTFSIVGFETWSMVLNIRYSFLFIGYVTAFFFTITWISTFTVVCCNRGSQGCATHALIENILSAIASSILLYYDARFLRSPYTCLWPGNLCSGIYWNVGWSILYDFNVLNAKLIAIKVQLSCAAIMLFLSVLFIVIYIYTSLKVGARSRSIDPQATIELTHRQPLAPPLNPVWSTQTSVWPPPTNA